MNLFKYVDIETASMCNRVCPTCIRNSHPDRVEVKSWFENHYIPMRVIRMFLNQVVNLGYRESVCLSHYNEPLLDERIGYIGTVAKSFGFSHVYFHTNGDLLTKDKAEELDGSVDKIVVSLYMQDPVKSERAMWIPSLFHKTKIDIVTQSDHVVTHFSPKGDWVALANEHRERPCQAHPLHLILNHRSEYQMCCDDVIGNFDLGTFPETSVEEYWFGEKHTQIVTDLEQYGGRLKYPYCSICPRS